MKYLILILSLIFVSTSAYPAGCYPKDENGCPEVVCECTEGDTECPKKLKICEQVIVECNDKVKEVYKYSEEIKTKLQSHIDAQDKHIKDLNLFIDDLEDYAKKNDANSWWNRNKMLIGFIGGVLFTGAAVWGAGQLAK